MKTIKTLAVALLCAMCSIGTDAAVSRREFLRDSLVNTLRAVTTSDDSITTLYNIYDLSSSMDQRRPTALSLLNLATRVGNDAVAMDMIRNIANNNQRDEELIDQLLEQLDQFPESDLKKETKAFVMVCKATGLSSNFLSEEERQNKILELIKEYSMSNTDDPYEKLVQLYTICSYLGSETHGELLTEYFKDLQRSMAELPLTTFTIRNKIYSQQAITYTNNGDQAKAIDADRHMLRIMDDMQETFRRNGRLYRNFDLTRYVCLRRILKNYKALTDEEAEAYFDQIQKVASRLPSAKADMEYYKQPQLCMMMKRGDYAEAIPLIKINLTQTDDVFSRRYFLQMLMEAAEAVGDRESLLKASLEYSQALEDFVKMKSAERYRELQIIYEVNRLKEQNTMNELERQRESNELQNIVIKVSIGALCLLVMVAIVFIVLFRRFRRLSLGLSRSNAELERESDELKSTRDELIVARDKAREAEQNKTDFINYISHEIITPLNTITEYSQMIIDSADESRRDYLRHFSDVVQLNTMMLQSFVLDLQDFSVLDSKRMSVKIRPTDIRAICLLSLDNVKINLKDSVKFRFPKANSKPVLIDTDPYRLQVVLLNLLINAAKFTDEGTVTLDYDVQPDKVVFTVTDTGCGVTPGMEEKIFLRYNKGGNTNSSGDGLGLPVCRLIATLLGGSIKLDTTYTGGARFIFTIPTSPAAK